MPCYDVLCWNILLLTCMYVSNHVSISPSEQVRLISFPLNLSISPSLFHLSFHFLLFHGSIQFLVSHSIPFRSVSLSSVPYPTVFFLFFFFFFFVGEDFFFQQWDSIPVSVHIPSSVFASWIFFITSRPRCSRLIRIHVSVNMTIIVTMQNTRSFIHPSTHSFI